MNAETAYNPYLCYICHEKKVEWQKSCIDCETKLMRSLHASNVLWNMNMQKKKPQRYGKDGIYELQRDLFKLFRLKVRESRLKYFIKTLKKSN